MSKIIACWQKAKLDHEGVTTAGCEKLGRFLRAEIHREKRAQQKPRGRMNTVPVCGMVTSLTYLHTRKALCAGNETASQEALEQLNEVNPKSVFLPVTGTSNTNKSSFPKLVGKRVETLIHHRWGPSLLSLFYVRLNFLCNSCIVVKLHVSV